MQIPKNIKITNVTGKTVAFLSPKADGLKDVYPDVRLNGESTLEFSLPATSEKINEITPECEIHAGNKVYIIRKDEAMDIVRDDKNTLWTKVMAVEKWYELDTDYVEPSISNDPTARPPADLAVIIVGGGSNLSGGRYPVGTAAHALYAILQGTGWTLGTVDVDGIRDIESEKESRLGLIKKVQEIWGGYLLFDSVNKIVHLRDAGKWQNYTGFQVRYKKNLKHITRTQSNKIVTKLYSFGHDDLDIAAVNGGIKYITNNSYTSREYVGIYKNQDIYNQSELLEKAQAELSLICRPRYLYKVQLVDIRVLPEYSHENYSLGDMIDIIDPDIAPDSPRPRIIRHKYNLFKPWECELDIGDPEERLIEQLKASFGTTQFIDGKFNGNGKFSGHSIEDLTIGTNHIQKLSITSDKIANLAIKSNHIENLSITSDKIANLAISGAKIDNLAITNSHIANLTITGGKIANATITTAKIEELIVGTNVTMGPNAYISWGNVNGKPNDLAYLDDIPYVPGYIKSTYIDSTRIESPNIIGGTITGGRIISDSTIDVTTNANIGKNLYMNATTFDQGIFFNTWDETSLTVLDPNGGILVRGGLEVSGAAYDSFETADGKIVYVSGGIITLIN
ncbi:phage tail spike protein [Tissierella sp.]|uniref:phage tail spike protein n=1 Tax=Tissierella sp. TaxID=41274 RepID=UPI00285BC3C4|nr:phage tail spike protein [Tissierella sp.]MDR7856066.1 phage tail spike protein [Tissierella sp.]